MARKSNWECDTRTVRIPTVVISVWEASGLPFPDFIMSLMQRPENVGITAAGIQLRNLRIKKQELDSQSDVLGVQIRALESSEAEQVQANDDEVKAIIEKAKKEARAERAKGK